MCALGADAINISIPEIESDFMGATDILKLHEFSCSWDGDGSEFAPVAVVQYS